MKKKYYKPLLHKNIAILYKYLSELSSKAFSTNIFNYNLKRSDIKIVNKFNTNQTNSNNETKTLIKNPVNFNINIDIIKSPRSYSNICVFIRDTEKNLQDYVINVIRKKS